MISHHKKLDMLPGILNSWVTLKLMNWIPKKKLIQAQIPIKYSMHRFRYCSIKPTKIPLVTTTSQMNPEWLLVCKNWAWRRPEEPRTLETKRLSNPGAMDKTRDRLHGVVCAGWDMMANGDGCGWMNNVKLKYTWIWGAADSKSMTRLAMMDDWGLLQVMENWWRN